jgi:hypothetical protein
MEEEKDYIIDNRSFTPSMEADMNVYKVAALGYSTTFFLLSPDYTDSSWGVIDYSGIQLWGRDNTPGFMQPACGVEQAYPFSSRIHGGSVWKGGYARKCVSSYIVM